MFCAFHKERLAHDKCCQCGMLLCPDCHRVLNGKIYCLDCFPKDIKNEPVKAFHPRKPLYAMLLSIFPGLGQVYNGQTVKGLFVFFSSWLIIPWLYGIYDAYVSACRINNREIESDPSPALLAGCLALVTLLMIIFTGGPVLFLKGLPLIIQNFVYINPEARVKKVFQGISGAVEHYQKEHDASFPGNEADLYFGDSSYLDEMYCGSTHKGYRYICDFSEEGYEVRALPLKQGLPRYRLTPGPVMEEF